MQTHVEKKLITVHAWTTLLCLVILINYALYTTLIVCIYIYIYDRILG
jgi:hypothetical protein